MIFWSHSTETGPFEPKNVWDIDWISIIAQTSSKLERKFLNSWTFYVIFYDSFIFIVWIIFNIWCKYLQLFCICWLVRNKNENKSIFSHIFHEVELDQPPGESEVFRKRPHGARFTLHFTRRQKTWQGYFMNNWVYLRKFREN